TGIPPSVLVHDVLIHPRERELVVGTHGRSIYVVDIAPLEEMTPAVLGSDVHLCNVRPVVAFKIRKSEGEKPRYSAPNPPYGAAVAYYLKEASAQPAAITILDKEDKTVTKIKGDSKAGLNTVVWDLRPAEGTDLVQPGEY